MTLSLMSERYLTENEIVINSIAVGSELTTGYGWRMLKCRYIEHIEGIS